MAIATSFSHNTKGYVYKERQYADEFAGACALAPALTGNLEILLSVQLWFMQRLPVVKLTGRITMGFGTLELPNTIQCLRVCALHRWRDIKLGSRKHSGKWSEEESETLRSLVSDYLALKQVLMQLIIPCPIELCVVSQQSRGGLMW